MSRLFESGGQATEFQLQHQPFNEYSGLISFRSFFKHMALNGAWETQDMQVQYLGQENPLEEVMETHSSILAQKILLAEEPGGHVQSLNGA